MPPGMPPVPSRRPLRRLLALVLPLAAGVLLAVWLMARPEGPARSGAEEAATPVEMIRVSELDYVPRPSAMARHARSGSGAPCRRWPARSLGRIPSSRPAP